MKKLTLLALSVATAGLIGACSHKEKKSAEPAPQQDPQAQAASQLDAEKMGYVNRVQARIDELSRNAADMRSRAMSVAKPNQKKVQNAADDLDSLLKDARTSLDSVRSADATHWVDYRRDVDAAMGKAESQYSNSLMLLK